MRREVFELEGGGSDEGGFGGHGLVVELNLCI